jgi:hypothetical protein
VGTLPARGEAASRSRFFLSFCAILALILALAHPSSACTSLHLLHGIGLFWLPCLRRLPCLPCLPCFATVARCDGCRICDGCRVCDDDAVGSTTAPAPSCVDI